MQGFKNDELMSILGGIKTYFTPKKISPGKLYRHPMIKQIKQIILSNFSLGQGIINYSLQQSHMMTFPHLTISLEILTKGVVKHEIYTQKENSYILQLDRTVSMAATKSSYFAPVISFTILLSFRILKVGTTLIPSSFARGCNNHQTKTM